MLLCVVMVGFCGLTDKDEASCDETGSRNVRKDLSDWQEKHAMLVLSRVEVPSILFLFVLSREFTKILYLERESSIKLVTGTKIWLNFDSIGSVLVLRSCLVILLILMFSPGDCSWQEQR